MPVVTRPRNTVGEAHRHHADRSAFNFTIADLVGSAINNIPPVHLLSHSPILAFLLSLQPSKVVLLSLTLADDLIFCFSEKTEAIVKESPQASTATSTHPLASGPHTLLSLPSHVRTRWPQHRQPPTWTLDPSPSRPAKDVHPALWRALHDGACCVLVTVKE